MFLGIIKKQNFMPVRTVENILTDLNTNHGNGWVEVRRINGLPIVNSGGLNLISFATTSGLVVKAFINANTAEVRFYLAKIITDIPERGNL